MPDSHQQTDRLLFPVIPDLVDHGCQIVGLINASNIRQTEYLIRISRSLLHTLLKTVHFFPTVALYCPLNAETSKPNDETPSCFIPSSVAVPAVGAVPGKALRRLADWA